ncbi:hypothetical protein WMY93_005483 [Mugilogobius chulae]|uniref:Hexosyltransferase n=1 Tax=Mugilogobius chulae TaxID=88201 RepID=A0AAW0PWA4_9GOBI
MAIVSTQIAEWKSGTIHNKAEKRCSGVRGQKRSASALGKSNQSGARCVAGTGLHRFRGSRLTSVKELFENWLMETGKRYLVGIVLLIIVTLSYFLAVSNIEHLQTKQFYLPPFKKAPSKAPEPAWEDPGPYHVAYPRNYRFILENRAVCKDSPPFVLLMVPVAPSDFSSRNIIRSSTGPGSEQLQDRLREENEKYHDLLQSSFTDSYRNLTIKTMVMLEWLEAACSSSVAYVVKVDSDMFLHVPNLVDLLLQPGTPKTNYMTGLVWWHSPVLRNYGNKFYMPQEVISEPVYPPYPLGMTYIMSLDLPHKILSASRNIKPIFIEDAYLGMCLKQLNISPTDPPATDMFQVNAQHPLSQCALSRIVATTTTSMPQMMSYWRRSQQPDAHC